MQRAHKRKCPHKFNIYEGILMKLMAEWTGLEPATPGVTGRYSNQLNYHSAAASTYCERNSRIWYLLGDSNPCSHRERVVS